MHADAEKETKKGDFGYSDTFLYKFMFSYMRPYTSELLKVLFLMITISVLTILGPVLLSKAIDRFTLENQGQLFGVPLIDGFFNAVIEQVQSVFPFFIENRIWLELIIISFLYFLIMVFIFLTTKMQIVLVGTVGIQATKKIREDLFTHLQELDMTYHDRNEVGRIISRTTSDVEAIREFLGGSIIQNVLNIFIIIAIALVILTMDTILALVSFSLIPIVIFISSLAKKYSRPRRKEVRRINAMLMANIAENISGIKVTKSMNRENQNIVDFMDLNQKRIDTAVNASMYSIMFFSILLFLSSLGTALIVGVGGIRVLNHAISLGTLTAFLNLNAVMFRPIVVLGNFYEQLQDALTGAERIYALLDTKTRTPWQLEKPDLPPINGEIELKNISFSYTEDIQVLKDFNLYIPAGAKVAIVGKTGAGKTTIANLISKMYEPQKGQLLIDGLNVSDYNLPSYRKQIALVPQDFFLFSFSIRENLKLGDPQATEEQMWHALELVGLKKFVEKLDKGLDTPLQERGGRLSIGQRQLLVFASVLLKNPQILILDEATSSIDVFTEIEIQRSINLLMKNRTSIVIAHRLSTIRDADIIYVIDHGKIVEQGTHEELIQIHGMYYELIKNQLNLAKL